MSSEPSTDRANKIAACTGSIDRHLKVNNNTLTKEEQDDFLRLMLPACQPQEGSPANTFTRNELNTLQKAVGNIEIKHGDSRRHSSNNIVDIRDLHQAFHPPGDFAASTQSQFQSGSYAALNDNHYDDDKNSRQEMTPSMFCPQDSTDADISSYFYHDDDDDAGDHRSYASTTTGNKLLDWYGAPRLEDGISTRRGGSLKTVPIVSQQFREKVRRGEFVGPTNGVCPGFLQCNLVVLTQKFAFDFLLFCQRNPKACPLIEVCDVGSAIPHGVATKADLRTDLPKYAIYRDGKLDREVTSVSDCWPKDSVAFLIGCSFSYDGELMNAGIPLKSASQGKNVPMYRTNIKCRPAGCLSGNMVVSMKPIPALQVSKHIEITSKYTHAHGGPVAVGSASAIGIKDINKPEWGELIDIDDNEIPVFHACGVTPQSILMDSKVPFAITHSAGHMFVTDLPSNLGV